jgi:hypothetical protein
MESVIKLCLKAMTRLNQTQSKLLNTICQKQKKKKHPKQDLSSEETPPETARAAHAPPQDNPCNRLKQEKPLGTTLHGKDTEHGHHARPKVRRTPWRVDATRRSPLSYPAVEGSV